jgi:ribose transport system substrate-binding protein
MKKFLSVLAIAALVITPMFANGASEKEDGPLKVGITIQSLQNSYWAGVFGEVETLLEEKGWDYTILGCNDSSATQIQHIENFITNDVDLIMVHPSDPHAIEDYLATAREAGIKVMCWDDKMVNTDVNWVLDNAELGKAIGAEAGKFIAKHYTTSAPAEVAIINYPQTPILLDRENGILAGLKAEANGKYSVVAQQPGLDAATSLTAMESILQANPNVKIVCSIGAGGDIGSNEAFMTKEKGNIPADMGIFSADATKQQLQAIVNGEATRASVGMEGSSIKTAEACVAMYEKLLTGYKFKSQDVYRPLTVMDSSNAAVFLADFK